MQIPRFARDDKFKNVTQLHLHHEFDPLHRSCGVFVDQGHVTRRQVYEFPPPSRVGNFHAQNTVRKTERPSPLCDRTAACDRPGQDRALARWRAMKSFSDDVFQAGGSTVQGMTPKSRMRSNGDRKDYRKETIVASENAASLYAAVEAPAAATLARFFASFRRCVAEYKLPRQRRAPHKQGASSSPS